MICSVCNLRKILKTSSHHDGLEKIWFVASNFETVGTKGEHTNKLLLYIFRCGAPKNSFIQNVLVSVGTETRHTSGYESMPLACTKRRSAPIFLRSGPESGAVAGCPPQTRIYEARKMSNCGAIMNKRLVGARRKKSMAMEIDVSDFHRCAATAKAETCGDFFPCTRRKVMVLQVINV